MDTSLPDSLQPDAAWPDSAQPDTLLPDSSLPDTWLPDLAQPDVSQADASTTTWWDNAWSCRRRLTFDNSAQTEDLEDFPVPIALTANRISYALTADGGTDLRFVDPATGLPLPHEIERWVTDGDSVVWVKAPLIAAGSSDGSVWMYYGNPSAANAQDPAAVWSAHYELVLHLDNMVDSSPSALLATNVGATASATPWARGRSFDGTGAYLDLGRDLQLLMATSSSTVTAWIRPDDSLGEQNILALSVNSTSATMSSRAAVELIDTELHVVARSLDTDTWHICEVSPPTALNGSWHQVDAVTDYAAGEIKIYLDGAELESCVASFSASATPATPTSYNAVGSQDDGSSGFFGGVMDEVRVARTARSAAWIRATNLTRLDAFVTFGAEETR